VQQRNHKKKKKKLTSWEKFFFGSFWFVLIILLIVVILLIPGRNYELVLGESQMEITGSYGDAWDYEEINSVRLVEELPEIKGRLFGQTSTKTSSGHFSFQEGEPFEKGMLFVHRDSPPYILIEFTNQKPVFLNAEYHDKTVEWYENLTAILAD
jgi:hypothetical protein